MKSPFPVIGPVLPLVKRVQSDKGDLLLSLLEVKSIEQEYVSPTCCCDFSSRRGRSRLAAHLQMGGGYCRLAGPDVGKCGRLDRGSLSSL